MAGGLLEANISVQGLDQLLAKLAAIDPALKNMEPQMQEAGDYLLQFLMHDVFASEGGLIGEYWRPLSEPYATRKAAKYGDATILIASGEMQQSYKLTTFADKFRIVNEKKTKSGEWLAGLHQEGTSRMPRRMMVKLQDEQLTHITGIIIGRLHQLLNF